MAIALFDKFLNTLPITVLEAKDISMVIMIDPPEGLPPSLLAGKGILDTEAKTISVYNSDGSAVAHTFDISTTDLQPLETELAAVKATAEAADALSKENKQTLNGIDLSKYAELGEDAEFNALTLKSKLVFSSPDGEEIDFTDSLKFNNGGFTKLSILNGSIDVNTQLSMSGTNQIINMASGGDNDTNAANIGDVKRIATEGSGLKPTDDEWDMLNLPVINVGESSETTSAATVGQVNTVSSVATAADTLSKSNETRLNNLPPAPDLSPYIKTGDEAELTSVSFTEDSEIHFRPESGLVLTSDSLCGEDLEGNKTFIVRDGEFNVKAKVVKEVSDGVEDNDAVNKKQLSAVEAKADTNTSNLSTLSGTVSGNTSEIASVKTTATDADTLSKANATRLDNLPPDPTPRVAALEENALQKDENGYDAKSFKILNLDSGEDVDSSAANIGDVKRIATQGSGLKPTDNEWDMLNLPVIHVQESAETDSAATVGQVNAVDAKIPDVSNFIETGTTATLNAVMFGGDTKVDYQADLGLVLQGDTIYGKSQAGLELFFIEDGKFNVKSKKIQKLRDGEADDDAVNLKQLNIVEGKADDAKSVADSAKSKADANESSIESLSATVSSNITEIGNIKSTADAADTLSKNNATRLDNLPPAPNLDDYAKKGEDVNFANTEVNILKVRKSDDTSKFSDILIDGNTNTELNFVGDTHFYVRDKADNSKGLEAFQIDSSARFIAKQKVKTPILTNLSTGSTDSSSANTGFIDLSTTGQVKVGAKTSVNFTIDGNDTFKVTSDSIDFSDLGSKAFIKQASGQVIDVSVGNVSNVEFTENGLKLTRDVDASNQNLKNVGDIEHSSNAIILGKSTGNLKVRNVGQITRNSTNEANSVTLGDGANTYKSNAHSFITNDDVPLATFDSSGLHIKNHHEDAVKDTTIKVDSSNQNTLYENVGIIYFESLDKSTGEKHKVFQTSPSSGAATFEKAVRSKEGFTSGTATFNTNTAGAGFVDLRESGEVKLGAHSKIVFAVAGKKPIEITGNQIDFSSLAETMKINHGHNIDVIVSGTTNVAFKSNGMKLLSAVDGNGQNINHSGDIHFNSGKKLFGSAAGNLQLRYVNSLWYGDGTGSNIQFNNSNDVRFTGDHIRWYHTDGTQYGGISKSGINLRDATKIVGLPQGSDDTDATNLGHIKELIAAGGGGGSTEEWFEVASGVLASTGDRPTGSTSDNKVNIWHTTVGSSTTSPPNEFKINAPSAYDKVGYWSYGLRYKLVQGDKVQYWETDENGWTTDNGNVWHLSASKVTGDDLSAGANTVISASPFIKPLETFKKYYSISSGKTYYEHQGDSHLYIDWTGNSGGTISLDTMRSGTDQENDLFALHNKSDTEMEVRFFFNGSSITQKVAARSFIQAWSNRSIGKWVIVLSKDPSFVPDQRVVKATDLNWALSSDPRTNTQRMIAAAPDMCTIIGRHIANGSGKEKIVSVGDTSKVETETSTFVVNKHSSTHATGICSSEANSGKTWSRILDGKRGAWFTNDTANTRMASSEIDPTEYQEDQLFFTTDKGVMETYLDESEEGEIGIIKLRQVEGYNVPKNEQDIAALEIQTEKNRSQTHYFINEGTLSYDWPDESRRPLVEVQVLNTMQQINNSSVTVTDNDEHTYGGEYNTVGSVAINSLGNWANQYVYHNAYKHVSEDYYVVFNQGNSSWQIIQAENPHTSIGSHAASVTVQLGGQSSLPETFGSYTIDPNFDNIDSLEFITAEVPVQYDDVNSRVIINFNGAKPSGYVVLK